MTDTSNSNQGPAELKVQPPKRSPLRNLSVVWLIPVLALAISLAVAWRSYSERGVLIEISFRNAAGVTAGETEVRYRDVSIGTVEEVGFSDDLSRVVVSARVDKAIAQYLDDEARFWVVRPKITAEGVTGLSTVLSGVYIEGTWDRTPGVSARSFEGLEEQPLVDPSEKGTSVTLRAADGQAIAGGSPVFYRGVRVGRTETPRLDDTGAVVLVEAFIEAPHDRLLTTATRFWNASGFSVSLGTSGFKLDVGSLATLISGGVAFNTFFSGGAPVTGGQVYDLYADETVARENAFSQATSNTVTVATVFIGGVSGLTPGSALFYKGVKIGEVATISAFVVEGEDQIEVHQQVALDIDPKLLGLAANASLSDVLDFLQAAVESGVRARLKTANLLSSSLIVELAEIEDPAPAELQRDSTPYALIPSVESDIEDVNATLEGVMKRVNALKIEDLIQQAISTLASIEAVAASDDMRAAPKAVVGLLDQARELIASDDVQALPGALRQTVENLLATLAEVRQAGAVARLVSVLENADAALANVSQASQQFPALVDDLRAVAAKARDLPVQELVESATALLDSADAMIDTDAARAMPASVNAALEEMRGLLSELREGGAAANANAALASARAAGESLERATADLPQLTERLERLLARAEELGAAYGGRSEFNAETLSMLREVRAAARSITALTRALERSPNSLLFGK